MITLLLMIAFLNFCLAIFLIIIIVNLQNIATLLKLINKLVEPITRLPYYKNRRRT